MEAVFAVSREAITGEGITEYLQVFNEAKFTIRTGTHGHGGDTDLKPGNSHVCKKVAVTFQCRPHLKKTQLKRTLGESPFAKQVL